MAPSRLTHIFRARTAHTLAALVLGSALSGCAAFTEPPHPLTTGEKDLVNTIFSGQVNTDIVNKYLDQDPNKCSEAKTISPRSIIFYHGHHAQDYSDRTKPESISLFAHEMTHIWQVQNWSLLKQAWKLCQTYNYDLTPKSRFEDFCNEQQAAMVEDYVRYYISAEPKFPLRLLNNEKPEKLALMTALIEKTFPGLAQERARTEHTYPTTLAAREKIETYRRENKIKTITVSVCR
ncbi:hypothetical protein [Micavibrio aeruginosavorus]|uniref:hypothetical protein n=1 Tax=Micavibrio aeruginosavorus TaxID=349221 RepID=UPI003F4ACC05